MVLPTAPTIQKSCLSKKRGRSTTSRFHPAKIGGWFSFFCTPPQRFIALRAVSFRVGASFSTSIQLKFSLLGEVDAKYRNPERKSIQSLEWAVRIRTINTHLQLQNYSNIMLNSEANGGERLKHVCSPNHGPLPNCRTLSPFLLTMESMLRT